MNRLLGKKTNELSKKKKKGFTLVELIIVIAIIAILAAIAIPKFGEIRDSANQKADIATAKNIASIVAQEIADGKTTLVTDGTPTPITATMIGKLDGNSTPKAKIAGTSPTFSYSISSGGNITIYYTSHGSVYPTYNPS